MSADVWSRGQTVHMTSFWGWHPATWGTVGYTSAGRLKTVLRTTTDPFIMVVYVTKSAPGADPDVRGKLTGFYLVSHIEGHRDAFTASLHHQRNPDKWRYSLKARQAFNFLPEYRLDIDDFDPGLAPRARSVAASGEELSPSKIERIRRIPYVAVPVYGGPTIVDPTIHVLPEARAIVRAGPVNRTGYTVGGEPADTEKELYVLVLDGDTSAYLGEPAAGRRICKIGMSMSPKTRLETFRSAMPKGAFTWGLYRSTRSDKERPYSGFEAALAGEEAMKEALGKRCSWLGGEFYAATNEQIAEAWEAGRSAACAFDARSRRPSPRRAVA
jgi:hypothetical protein